ncbi:MAG TPA: hypothetical protein VNV42_00300 [Solirubrobacteraceae bacterium]|nr:hypothetical protein [Solirubrobacteraceae bacterium]
MSAARAWACAFAGVLVCALTCAGWLAPPAGAIAYVDGISDQDIATWDGTGDGYFANWFAKAWVEDGHIAYVRYVVQWNAMLQPSDGPNPGGDYRERFEAWYDAVEAHTPSLTLDLSLSNFVEGGHARPTPSQYREALERILDYATAARVVEPWNEPDNGGEAQGLATGTHVAPVRAAEYAMQAATACNAHRCTTVVGNLLDCETCQMVRYEHEYREALKGWSFRDWGMHPYVAVKQERTATVDRFLENWGDGATSLWLTEVGAFVCEDYGSTVTWTEAQQSQHAEWLVKNLLPGAAHVFYYDFLDGYNEQPQRECEAREGKPDTALYVPGGGAAGWAGSGTPDRPRPAAAWIFDDQPRAPMWAAFAELDSMADPPVALEDPHAGDHL